MPFGAILGTGSAGATSIPDPAPISIAATVAAGDLIVCVISQQTALTAVGASDNLGNIYYPQNAGSDPSTPSGRMFWALVTIPGSLTTVNIDTTASTNNYSAVAAAIQGPFAVSQTSPDVGTIDANPSNSSADATSPFVAPATGTLAQTPEYVISWAVKNDGAAWTAGSPDQVLVQNVGVASAHVILGGAVAYTADSVALTFTSASNPSSLCIMGTASFKARDSYLSLAPALYDDGDTLSTPVVGGIRFLSIGTVGGGGKLGGGEDNVTLLPVQRNVDAGTLVIVLVGTDNCEIPDDVADNAITSVVDSAGNIYEKAGGWRVSDGASTQTGASVSVWFCVIGNALTDEIDSITATFFRPSLAHAAAISAWNFSIGGADVTVAAVAHDIQHNLGLDTLNATTANTEHLRIRAIAFEWDGGVNFTPTSTWTEFTAADSSFSDESETDNIVVRGEWKISVGTGAASAPTSTPNTDNVSFYVAFSLVVNDLMPGLHVDADAFFAHQIAPSPIGVGQISSVYAPVIIAEELGSFTPSPLGVAALGLSATLHVDNDAFFTHAVAGGAVALGPTLWTDADAFFTHTLAGGVVNLAPTTYSESDGFFTHTVATAGTLGSVIGQIFSVYAPVAIAEEFGSFTPALGIEALALAATLHVDSDIFFTHVVTRGAVDLTPTLWTDTDAFFTHTLATGAVNLTPSLFADTETFFTHIVAGGAVNLTTTLYSDVDAFFVHTVTRGAVDLAPTLYADGETFFTHSISVGAVDLAPQLYAENDAFFTHVVSLGGVVLQANLFVDSDAFFTHTVAAGAVNLAPTLYADGDAFFSQTIGQAGQIIGQVVSVYVPIVLGEELGSFAPGAMEAVAPDLFPSLHVDSDIFFTHVVTRGVVDLAPSLHVDSDAFSTASIATEVFGTAAGAIFESGIDLDVFADLVGIIEAPPVDVPATNLSPTLYVDTDTFFTHLVALAGQQNLFPTLYADNDQFFTHVVGRGAVNLAPTLYTDNDTFFTHVIATTRDLAPSLYSDTDGFFIHVVTVGAIALTPTLYSDTDVFFTHAALLEGVLAPSLYVDTDGFQIHVVTTGAVSLQPSLYSDSDAFFTHAATSSKNLQPQTYSDVDAFFTHVATVSAVDLAPTLYQDADTFFTHSLASTRVLAASLYADTDSFFVHVVGTIFPLAPSLYQDSDAFFTHAITTGAVDLAASLYVDTDALPAHTVLLGVDQELMASLFSDPDAFLAAIVAMRTPTDRVINVDAELRRADVNAEDRQVNVDAETRSS